MVDTMLRSGVPPHIGQSPEPGSDADIRARGIIPATTTMAMIVAALNHEAHEDHKEEPTFPELIASSQNPVAVFVVFVFFVVPIIVSLTIVAIIVTLSVVLIGWPRSSGYPDTHRIRRRRTIPALPAGCRSGRLYRSSTAPARLHRSARLCPAHGLCRRACSPPAASSGTRYRPSTRTAPSLSAAFRAPMIRASVAASCRTAPA